MNLPALDQNICGAWTQQQTDTYNKSPFFFMKKEIDTRKSWLTFQKLLGSISWKPNQGDTMRVVGAEPTPVLRQTAYPTRIHTGTVTADVIAYRERKMDAFVYEHNFVTPHFYFVPEWTDFMKHIDETITNVNRQIVIYEDTFYRTMLTDKAPYIYIAGIGLVPSPTGIGNAAGDAGGSKTNAWWVNQIVALLGVPEGYLSFSELFKVLNDAENSIGMSPFDGSGTPRMDSTSLDGRYLLIGHNEVWNNFVNDPWTKENRPLNMDIVTGPFKGDIFGRIRFRHERWARRFNIDTENPSALLSYAPETVELNTAAENFGQTQPNLQYTQIVPNPDANQIQECSPYELAYLVGRTPGDSIDVGPPPAEFTRSMPAGEGVKMNWNGKTYLTKDFLIPCTDANGVATVEMNSWGRYARGQATATLGVSLFNNRNFLPILFKRRVGINTVTA